MLAPLAAQIKLGFVFCSVAQQEEAAASNIDILLVGEASFRDVVEALYTAQATLGREIRPKHFWRRIRGQGIVRAFCARRAPRSFLLAPSRSRRMSEPGCRPIVPNC